MDRRLPVRGLDEDLRRVSSLEAAELALHRPNHDLELSEVQMGQGTVSQGRHQPPHVYRELTLWLRKPADLGINYAGRALRSTAREFTTESVTSNRMNGKEDEKETNHSSGPSTSPRTQSYWSRLN